MNPTIAKYREAIEICRPDGMDVSVSIGDLAALLDIAEAASDYVETSKPEVRGSAYREMCDALARAEEREACAVICDSFFLKECVCPRCQAGKVAATLRQGAPDAKPE